MTDSRSIARDVLTIFDRGLAVSCQAPEGTPLRDPAIRALMAVAAELGGARGIRAEGIRDIAAIRESVTLPIIGKKIPHHRGAGHLLLRPLPTPLPWRPPAQI